MGNVLIAVALVLSAIIGPTIAVAAVVPSGVPSISLGTYPTGGVASKSVSSSSIANQFTLVAGAAAGVNTGYYKFVKMGAQTTSAEQYQVTTGKTAYCQPTISSPSAINFMFGYGTAALVAEATITAPTGEKKFAGSTAVGQIYGAITANTPFPMGIVISFPAQSYPFLFGTAISASNFAVWLNCEEF